MNVALKSLIPFWPYFAAGFLFGADMCVCVLGIMLHERKTSFMSFANCIVLV